MQQDSNALSLSSYLVFVCTTVYKKAFNPSFKLDASETQEGKTEEGEEEGEEC